MENLDGWGQRMSKDHVRIELATLASLRPGGGARHFLSSSGRPGMHDVAQGLRNALPVALAEDPQLAKFTGVVQNSGEGRWTIQAAIEEAVSADVLTAVLFGPFRFRQEHTFAEKMLSAKRDQFGGHVEIYPGN